MYDKLQISMLHFHKMNTGILNAGLNIGIFSTTDISLGLYRFEVLSPSFLYLVHPTGKWQWLLLRTVCYYQQRLAFLILISRQIREQHSI